MFPIKGNHKFGYLFGTWTFYGTRHRGLDVIAPTGTKVYAPTGGVAVGYNGIQGGTTIHLDDGKYIHRFMHLSKRVKLGKVKEGDVIGLVGNTGTFTTGAHLHWDISIKPLNIYNFNNFIDPLKYASMNTMETPTEQIKRLQKEVGKLTDIVRTQEKLIASQDDRIKQETEDKIKNYGLWQECLDNENSECRKQLDACLSVLAEIHKLSE